MAITRYDIELQRNDTFRREFAIADAAGVAVDLSTATLSLKVRYNGGAPGSALATATVSLVGDGTAGILEVLLTGDQFSSVPGEQERVPLAYDLLATISGDDIILMRGELLLVPGVS